MELTEYDAFGRLAPIVRDAVVYSEAVILFTGLPVTQTWFSTCAILLTRVLSEEEVPHGQSDDEVSDH